MTDEWKSIPRIWCPACKCYFEVKKGARSAHEQSKRHVEKMIEYKAKETKTKERKEQQAQAAAREFAAAERKARKHMQSGGKSLSYPPPDNEVKSSKVEPCKEYTLEMAIKARQQNEALHPDGTIDYIRFYNMKYGHVPKQNLAAAQPYVPWPPPQGISVHYPKSPPRPATPSASEDEEEDEQARLEHEEAREGRLVKAREGAKERREEREKRRKQKHWRDSDNEDTDSDVERSTDSDLYPTSSSGEEVEEISNKQNDGDKQDYGGKDADEEQLAPGDDPDPVIILPPPAPAPPPLPPPPPILVPNPFLDADELQQECPPTITSMAQAARLLPTKIGVIVKSREVEEVAEEGGDGVKKKRKKVKVKYVALDPPVDPNTGMGKWKPADKPLYLPHETQIRDESIPLPPDPNDEIKLVGGSFKPGAEEASSSAHTSEDEEWEVAGSSAQRRRKLLALPSSDPPLPKPGSVSAHFGGCPIVREPKPKLKGKTKTNQDGGNLCGGKQEVKEGEEEEEKKEGDEDDEKGGENNQKDKDKQPKKKAGKRGGGGGGGGSESSDSDSEGDGRVPILAAPVFKKRSNRQSKPLRRKTRIHAF